MEEAFAALPPALRKSPNRSPVLSGFSWVSFTMVDALFLLSPSSFNNFIASAIWVLFIKSCCKKIFRIKIGSTKIKTNFFNHQFATIKTIIFLFVLLGIDFQESHSPLAPDIFNFERSISSCNAVVLQFCLIFLKPKFKKFMQQFRKFLLHVSVNKPFNRKEQQPDKEGEKFYSL